MKFEYKWNYEFKSRTNYLASQTGIVWASGFVEAVELALDKATPEYNVLVCVELDNDNIEMYIHNCNRIG